MSVEVTLAVDNLEGASMQETTAKTLKLHLTYFQSLCLEDKETRPVALAAHSHSRVTLATRWEKEAGLGVLEIKAVHSAVIQEHSMLSQL